MSSKGAATKRKQPSPVEPQYQEPLPKNDKKQKSNQQPTTALTQLKKETTTTTKKPEAKAPAPSPTETKKAGKATAVSFAPAPVVNKPTPSAPSKAAAKAPVKGGKQAPAPVVEESEEDEDEMFDYDEDDVEFDFDEDDFEGDFDGFEGEFDCFDDEDFEFDDEDDEEGLPMYDDEEEEVPRKEGPVFEATKNQGNRLLNIRPIKKDEEVVAPAAPKDGKFPSTFAESNISPELKKALKAMNIVEPNKLQQAALGPLLHGKDALTIAGATSGKTVNAILPALQLMLEAGWKQRNFTGTIILAPTRERALLTYQTVKKLTQFNHGVSHSMCLGNTNPLIQFQKLQKGVSVIVATPQRLLQQMETHGAIFYKNTMSLIIDDLDTMCDMGFAETIIKIAQKLDPLRHTICVSNANTRAVQKVAKSTMRSPLLIGCKTLQQQSAIKPTEEKNFKTNNQRNAEVLKQELIKFEMANTNNYIEHGYLSVATDARFNVLYSYIKKSLLKKTVIFVQTEDEVKYLVAILRAFDIVTLGLHEGLSDVNRTKTFFEFQNAKAGAVVFVTELGLRGIKFTVPVSNIIHYGHPITMLKYLERLAHFPAISGKTAKLNSIIFVLKENEESSFATTFTTKLTFTSFDPPKQQIDVFKETLRLTEGNFFLHTAALKAYFAFMRCYIQYSQDGVYDYKGIDITSLAHSFGMQHPPAIKE